MASHNLYPAANVKVEAAAKNVDGWSYNKEIMNRHHPSVPAKAASSSYPPWQHPSVPSSTSATPVSAAASATYPSKPAASAPPTSRAPYKGLYASASRSAAPVAYSAPQEHATQTHPWQKGAPATEPLQPISRPRQAVLSTSSSGSEHSRLESAPYPNHSTFQSYPPTVGSHVAQSGRPASENAAGPARAVPSSQAQAGSAPLQRPPAQYNVPRPGPDFPRVASSSELQSGQVQLQRAPPQRDARQPDQQEYPSQPVSRTGQVPSRPSTSSQYSYSSAPPGSNEQYDSGAPYHAEHLPPAAKRPVVSVYDYGISQHRDGNGASADHDVAYDRTWPQRPERRDAGAPTASRIPPSEAIRRLQTSHAPATSRHSYPALEAWQRDSEVNQDREREPRYPDQHSKSEASQYPSPANIPSLSGDSPSSAPHRPVTGPKQDSNNGTSGDRSAIRSSLLQKLAAGAGDQVGLSASQIDQVVQVVKLLNSSKSSSDETAGSSAKTQERAVPSLPVEKPSDHTSEPAERLPVDVESPDNGVSLVFPKDSAPPLVPLPSHLRKSAESGEYVQFHHLLFDSMHPPAAVKAAEEESKKSDDLDVLVSDGLTGIRGIQSWLLAWSRFMRCYLAKRPHRAMELVHYQCFILEMSARYSGPAWMSYDAAFRKLISQQPDMRWDKPVPELFRTWFKEPRLRTHPMDFDLQQATPQVVNALPIVPGLSFPPPIPPPVVGLSAYVPVPSIPPRAAAAAAAVASLAAKHAQQLTAQRPKGRGKKA